MEEMRFEKEKGTCVGGGKKAWIELNLWHAGEDGWKFWLFICVSFMWFMMF